MRSPSREGREAADAYLELRGSESEENIRPGFGIGYGDQFVHSTSRPSSQTQDEATFSIRQSRGRSTSASSYVMSRLQEAKDWVAKEFEAITEAATGNESANQEYVNSDESYYKALVPQADVPVVLPQILQHKKIDHNVYRTITAKVPFGVEPGESFTVALPTGENRSVIVPRAKAASGDKLKDLIVCFRGDDLRDLNEEDNPEVKGESNLTTEERILELYLIHRPVEREAILLRNHEGFGLTVYEGKYGVHIHTASFTGIESMLKADDIIVSANDRPISTQKDLHEILRSENLCELGSAVTLSILRKLPPVMLRCPQGKELLRLSFDTVMNTGMIRQDLRCKICNQSAWESKSKSGIQAYACKDCLWTLCNECLQRLNSNMMSNKNANEPPPNWSSSVEESLGEKLSFDESDIGRRIRIFWHSTGDWWLGEVSAYSADHGHTIEYPEGDRLSKEVVPNMHTREYRVLKTLTAQSNSTVSTSD